MKQALHLSLVCFLAVILFQCQKAPEAVNTDQSAELASIEKAIHGCIGWAKNKDFKLLYSIIADDSSYLEVDPGKEMIVGIDQFKRNEAFWNSPNFKTVRYEIRDLKVNLSRSGDVAWFYCMLDDVNEWKGRPANWMNTRWTGVLEKKGRPMADGANALFIRERMNGLSLIIIEVQP